MPRFLRMITLAFTLILPLSLVVWSSDVRASASYSSPYTFEQTFSTALRMLRVDMGLKVTEKDSENGYILFEYVSPESGKRTCAGAIELVKGKQAVQVTVQIPAMPQYHEQMLADVLAKKLATDHGEPPKKKDPTPPAPPPSEDGGAPDAG
ncbi:MAG: hypothetical protein IPK82_43015 [Polyangiaceae bacterium]|nr:hypothetical protein [Polyangiaceae bacterium]